MSVERGVFVYHLCRKCRRKKKLLYNVFCLSKRFRDKLFLRIYFHRKYICFAIEEGGKKANVRLMDVSYKKSDCLCFIISYLH